VSAPLSYLAHERERRGGGGLTMRYQIADGIIDYIHLCWLAFLLAPLGAGDTMAACTSCGANARAKAQ